MVKAIKVLNGFATQLPAIGNKVFQFTDGLNVLFAPNGAGKSVLLKSIKAYCGIEKGGWSQISNFLKLGAGHQTHFPFVYRQYAPGQCDCVVAWDGTPTFFNDGDVKIDNFAWFFSREALSEDGMTDEVDQMKFLTDKPSSGQYRMKKLNKLFNMAKEPPDLANGGTPNNHSAEHMEIAFIKSLPRTGRVTILLDEPDRALSLPKQLELFKVLTELSKDFQIIVATHSPFVLFSKEMNLIDMEGNYAVECMDIFKKCIAEKESQ